MEQESVVQSIVATQSVLYICYHGCHLANGDNANLIGE